MGKAIPNQGLIRYLIENYYQDSIKPQESSYISSHWKYFSELFKVEVDSEGNLISLSGAAFGSTKWGGFVHRFLDLLCIFSYLIHLPHRREILRLKATMSKICDSMGLDPTLDVFRQVCTLELLKRKLPDEIRTKHMHVLMIGDGYGVLSALFKSVFPNSTLILVDIGKTLLFQAYYIQKAHPDCAHGLADMGVDLGHTDFVYCPTERLEILEKFKFDIAINIVSMQEMNNHTVARYYAFLRNHLHCNNLFYCCNRESKMLSGGELSEFLKYPWQNGDRYLVDEYCPWTLYFFSRVRAKNGLYLFGFRIPFANFYDGKIMHRLAILDTS